jgi:hypothetical protein
MKLITLLKEIALFEISLEAIKDQFVDNPKPNRSITPEEYEEIVAASGEKSAYATWMATKVADKKIKGEDIYKYKDYFILFDKNKRKFPSPDINAYGKTLELSDFINKAIELKSSIEQDPSLAKGVSKSDKYSKFKIGEVGGFAVYKIPQGSDDLYNVSCELGSGTEWCTATGKTRSHFDRHINQGSLYIFDNGKGEKYQFHYESNQFRDKNDNSIFNN